MKCPIETQETSEVLLACCARRLDAQTRALLERHMRDCPACREWYAGQRAVWDALDAWEPLPVSPDFDRRLYRAIDRDERSAWWRRLARPPGAALLRRALPVMAAACLLVVAGALVDTSRRPPARAGELRMDVVQAEQVERTLEDMELLQSLNQEVRAPAPSPM